MQVNQSLIYLSKSEWVPPEFFLNGPVPLNPKFDLGPEVLPVTKKLLILKLLLLPMLLLLLLSVPFPAKMAKLCEILGAEQTLLFSGVGFWTETSNLQSSLFVLWRIPSKFWSYCTKNMILGSIEFPIFFAFMLFNMFIYCNSYCGSYVFCCVCYWKSLALPPKPGPISW